LNLVDLGWNPILESHFNEVKEDASIPGRVIHHSKRQYKVITSEGEVIATISGSFSNSVEHRSEYPSVGDWVVIKKANELHPFKILSVLPRKNKLSRKVPGTKSQEQVIASNIDIVFIVTSCDNDFNIRRLERYLSMVLQIDAQPIVILNKTDVCQDPNTYLQEAVSILKDVPVHTISAGEGYELDRILPYIQPGKTIVLLGSSGVGKSTLINRLIGYHRQKVGEIRKSDGKGRHVTSSRELIVLPNGGLVIDNPGIREIQLWSSEAGISETFQDIKELSSSCRFKDCDHDQEPGCAVKEAIANGELPEERLINYNKLMREHRHSEFKRSDYERRKQERKLTKVYRQVDLVRKARGKQ